MKILTTQRVRGRGFGTEIGYPTINLQFDLGTKEEGLWISLLIVGTGWSRQELKSIASVSNYKGATCVEVYSLTKLREEIKVGEDVSIIFIKKIRDKVKITDPKEQIKSDIELANNTELTTCETCSRFYSQDYGYSNWTVEGTSYGCYANQFEEMQDDDYMKYNAEDCIHYEEGEMWVQDCDGESERPSESWLKSLERDVKLKELGI